MAFRGSALGKDAVKLIKQAGVDAPQNMNTLLPYQAPLAIYKYNVHARYPPISVIQ